MANKKVVVAFSGGLDTRMFMLHVPTLADSARNS